MKSNYALVVFNCLLFSMLLTGCVENTNIKSISVKYYLGVFETICSIPYEELKNAKAYIDTIEVPGVIINEKSHKVNIQTDSIEFRNYDLRGIIDTLITNPQVLCQIKQAMSRLKISSTKDTLEDVRIICTIEYQNGKKDYLDMGGIFAEGLRFNGYSCNNELEMTYLLKKNSGYYSRMPNEMLRRFYELADTCFKDTLTNELGQKYWRGKYPPLI